MCFVLIEIANERPHRAMWSTRIMATYVVWLIGNFFISKLYSSFVRKLRPKDFHAPTIVDKLPQIQFITYTFPSHAAFHNGYDKLFNELRLVFLRYMNRK